MRTSNDKKEEKGNVNQQGGKSQIWGERGQLIMKLADWVSKMITAGRNVARLSRSTDLLDKNITHQTDFRIRRA